MADTFEVTTTFILMILAIITLAYAIYIERESKRMNDELTEVLNERRNNFWNYGRFSD